MLRCKAERQYLLTLDVSRYSRLALLSSVGISLATVDVEVSGEVTNYHSLDDVGRGSQI